MKHQTLLRSAALALLCLVPSAPAAAQTGGEAPRTEPYPARILDAARELPVQANGRIKPFMTQAQYLLLRLKEVSSLRLPDDPKFGALAGEKLEATAWALDVMLHPEQAADYPVFRVTDREVLDWVGLSNVYVDRKKRDSYSWNELSPAYDRVWQFHGEYTQIDPKLRSRLQNQVVDMATDLGEYAGLLHSLDVLRMRFPVGDGRLLGEIFGERAEVRFSEIVEQTPLLLQRYSTLVERMGNGSAADPAVSADVESTGAFLEAAFEAASRSSYVVWIPPPDPDAEKWLSLDEAMVGVREWTPEQRAAVVGSIRHAEAVVDAAGDDALGTAMVAWTETAREQALARGEAGKLPLEVSYLRGDYFGKALVGFVLSFVLATLVWLRPRNKWFARATFAAMLASTGVLVYGIGVRCVLRGRPPVTTLYETILFITACAVIVALVAEWLNKQRIAISLGAALGAIGMFIAYRFELTDGQDTMPQLVAVLDTNFWLATHVTTVTIGYSAGLLAGFVAHVYLLGKLFGWRRGDKKTYSNLGRTIYGVLCFGLFFSTVGTILGGIWANESWGRFWGWDPKENGALMIVLWELMILHGRMGGYWRDAGIAMLAVVGNVVVAFSWWGVNLMGVGLHSYGFTAGLKQAVTIFYASQALVLGLGILGYYLEKSRQRSEQLAAAGAKDSVASKPA